MANTAEAPIAGAGPDWRARVIHDPEAILDDRDLMRALTRASEARRGDNVVDMRALAMERLEARLDRLEDTHRAVVANAYDNLAGTTQIHRCVLAILACRDLGELLDALDTEVRQILRVASVRLAIEGGATAEAPHRVVACLPAGGVAAVTGGDVTQAVILRATPLDAPEARGEPNTVRSEALLSLDLGPGRSPALLVLGATDAEAFREGQATDLLAFLGGCAGRVLRRMIEA